MQPGEERETWIMYFDTGGNPVHWNGGAWAAGNNRWTTHPMGTELIYELISDGANWHVEVYDAGGTLLTSTTQVPWTSVLDNGGEDYWFYWGDVYTGAYFHDADSNWVWLRDYVSPEPTSGLGAEEMNTAYCPATATPTAAASSTPTPTPTPTVTPVDVPQP